MSHVKRPFREITARPKGRSEDGGRIMAIQKGSPWYFEAIHSILRMMWSGKALV